MKKRICYLFLVELVSVLLLSVIWELWLENTTFMLKLFGHEPEPFNEGIEYIATSFAFVVIALILPFRLIMKNVATLEKTRDDLQKSLDDIKSLKGLLSMCAHCRKIRQKNGSWQELEDYMWEQSDTQISHGICPDCKQKYYNGV